MNTFGLKRKLSVFWMGPFDAAPAAWRKRFAMSLGLAKSSKLELQR